MTMTTALFPQGLLSPARLDECPGVTPKLLLLAASGPGLPLGPTGRLSKQRAGTRPCFYPQVGTALTFLTDRAHSTRSVAVTIPGPLGLARPCPHLGFTCPHDGQQAARVPASRCAGSPPVGGSQSPQRSLSHIPRVPELLCQVSSASQPGP